MAAAAPASNRYRYAWLIVGLAFMTMLASAGIRSTPGVLMIPMEHDTGWTAATISVAAAINIALFGLMGPFTAALMQSIGIRKTMLLGLTICAVATALTSRITTPFELVLTWGIGVGIGAGLIGSVVAATVAARWFVARRGTVVGILTAANATGQLIFLPVLARIAETYGWRLEGLVVSGIALAVAVPIALFMREKPGDIGRTPYGAPADWTPPPNMGTNPIGRAFGVLGRAAKRPVFWILFGTFFICGASTNGFIGTHFISACGDHGIPESSAAGYLALMGAFDLIGTVASGWLSDRVNPRYLLFAYYGLRGLSLFFVTSAFGVSGVFGLPLFAVFYGLDWIATLPPTVRLTLDAFGESDGPVVFGWVVAGHQLGAAWIVSVAGLIRSTQGSYDAAFALSATLCIVAAITILTTGRAIKRQPLTTAPAA